MNARPAQKILSRADQFCLSTRRQISASWWRTVVAYQCLTDAAT